MAHGWSSRASCGPTPCRAHRPPWPTSWVCATWPSRSTTCRRLSTGQLPGATDWSAASASTRAPGGWPTSGGRKGSSSPWPSASAEPGPASDGASLLPCWPQQDLVYGQAARTAEDEGDDLGDVLGGDL